MFVRNNREKRKLKENNHDTNLPNQINSPSFYMNDKQGNQKSTISIEYGKINNQKTNNNNAVSANNLPKTITMTSTPIYTYPKDASSVEYVVKNVIYNETDCYELTKTIKTKAVYTESDRQRFEDIVLNEYPDLMLRQHLTEQQKDEYRQLVEYWANGETVFSQRYIVTKQNCAVLFFSKEIKQQNNNGQWFVIEKTTEEYQEGKNKKYYPTYCTKFVRNYNGSLPNIDNLATLIVRTSINRMFSLDSTTIMPRKLKSTYEDFCERVDKLDDAMLLDWNKYNE
jgi:hypothetical protein